MDLVPSEEASKHEQSDGEVRGWLAMTARKQQNQWCVPLGVCRRAVGKPALLGHASSSLAAPHEPLLLQALMTHLTDYQVRSPQSALELEALTPLQSPASRPSPPSSPTTPAATQLSEVLLREERRSMQAEILSLLQEKDVSNSLS
jgi:hypothetical protein